MAEGVKWPLNEKGKPTNAHTRIELPKNKRLIAHYIAKYMSKAFEMPKEYGYISGHSEVLEDLKESYIYRIGIASSRITGNLQAIQNN